MAINVTDFQFSENGAVGEGEDGRFYALAWCGDLYAVADTREEAQAALTSAEPKRF